MIFFRAFIIFPSVRGPSRRVRQEPPALPFVGSGHRCSARFAQFLERRIDLGLEINIGDDLLALQRPRTPPTALTTYGARGATALASTRDGTTQAGVTALSRRAGHPRGMVGAVAICSC